MRYERGAGKEGKEGKEGNASEGPDTARCLSPGSSPCTTANRERGGEGREGKGKEGEGREGKGREGKGRALTGPQPPTLASVHQGNVPGIPVRQSPRLQTAPGRSSKAPATSLSRMPPPTQSVTTTAAVQPAVAE